MKKIFIFTLLSLGMVCRADEPSLELLSQTFGHNIVENLESSGLKLDVAQIIIGMNNSLAGKPAPLTEDQFETALLARQESAFIALAEKNLAAAVTFLAQNAKAEGVVEIIPGKLQYKIIQKGAGAIVKEHAKPTIYYSGKYVDGTVFASSLAPEASLALPLDETIPGCSMGITGMHEGEKRILYIHPDLAYGMSGQLLPNSLLIFEIEVVKAEEPVAATPEEK